jgi:uncharacterized glyoxalase superfamily protein PhnB
MAAKRKTATRKARAATAGRAREKKKARAGRATPSRAARPKRHQPETLRLRSVTPSFTVADVEKSLSWYRDVLGFHPRDRWEQDGKLSGVEMVAGSVTFVLNQDDWKKGRDRVKGEGFRIYCETVQDVDVLAVRAKAQGAKLTQEPRDQPMGMRDFSLVDPDGFKITIGVDLKK